MSKINLADLASGYNISTINSNFQEIAEVLDNEVLFRDNPVGEPNQMQNTLDMNGQHIINLPAPTGASEPARLQDVRDAVSGATTAVLTSFVPYLGVTATNVQGAIQQVYDQSVTSLMYTPPFTGATSQDLRTKQQQFISLKDFGAVGDGVANDAPAIQAAIDYILSTNIGGTIHATKGIYRCNTAINIPKTFKTLRLTGEGQVATTFQGGIGFSGPLFILGAGSSAAGGVDYIFEDFGVINPASGSMSTAFSCLNMNICKWIRVGFIGSYTDCIQLNACFATRFIDCFANGPTGHFINSSNACHNLVLDGGNFFGVGGVLGQVLFIGAATNNIVIQNADFESCASIYNIAAGSSSVRVTGNYIEFCVNQEFFHNGGQCFNVCIDNNWIALNTGGTVTYQNWEGGTFVNNTVFSQTINFAISCGDIDTGLNFLMSGGHVAQCPFQSPGSFTNNWTAGASGATYKKLNNGVVELRGNLNSGVGSVGNPAFTLFSAYRPAQDMRFPVVQGDNTIGVIVITASTGAVTPLSAAGGSIRLDGIVFTAKPE